MMHPIPEGTREGIDLYVKYGECGQDSFLEALLSNDLKEAFGRADDHNLEALHAIVSYCCNHIPSICWGSPEKVRAWSEARRADQVEPERSELGDRLWDLGVATMRAQAGDLC